MKKKIAMAIAAGVMAVSLMTACGGGSDSGGATEATTKAAAATEAAVSKDSAAADSTGDVSYVDGYYANDGNGNDFIIAFYEGAAGDVAYVNDGTNEALAEYTVENAETSEGEAYLLITVGNTTLGYIADGDSYYIVDDEGNVYGAAKLSEEEANTIYAALTEAAN